MCYNNIALLNRAKLRKRVIVIEEYENLNVVVDPEIITNSFSNLPFPLRKNYKEYCKSFKGKKKEDANVTLALEIRNALKTKYTKLYSIGNIVIIVKTRISKNDSNKGKSSGWRIIGLLDHTNKMFILFNVYSHAQGIDNITKEEKEELIKIAKEYHKELNI